VYKTMTCGYCTAAVRFLRRRKGLEVEVIDLTFEPEARRELARTTGQRTVPQIFIGEHHVGGYDDLRSLDQRGELDPLLTGV